MALGSLAASRCVRALLIAGACASVGCYRAGSYSIHAAPISVEAKTPLRIMVPKEDGHVAVDQCTVRSAVVNIRQLRGDTLFFTNILIRPPRAEQAACAVSGPGFLSLADNPDMKIVSLRRNRARTVLIAGLSTAGAVFVFAILGMAYAGT